MENTRWAVVKLSKIFMNSVFQFSLSRIIEIFIIERFDHNILNWKWNLTIFKWKICRKLNIPDFRVTTLSWYASNIEDFHLQSMICDNSSLILKIINRVIVLKVPKIVFANSFHSLYFVTESVRVLCDIIYMKLHYTSYNLF